MNYDTQEPQIYKPQISIDSMLKSTGKETIQQTLPCTFKLQMRRYLATVG